MRIVRKLRTSDDDRADRGRRARCARRRRVPVARCAGCRAIKTRFRPGSRPSSGSRSTTRGSTALGAGAARSSRSATSVCARAGDATPFLTARSASVGFDTLDLVLRLATGRELAHRPAHVRRHRVHARQDRGGRVPLAGSAGRQRRAAARCKCRPTSTCSCATAACSTSTPRAASRGHSRTSTAACAATTRC